MSKGDVVLPSLKMWISVWMLADRVGSAMLNSEEGVLRLPILHVDNALQLDNGTNLSGISNANNKNNHFSSSTKFLKTRRFWRQK